MRDIDHYRQWNRAFDSARAAAAETLANDSALVLRSIHAGLQSHLSENPNDARSLGLCAGITDVLDQRVQQFEPEGPQEPERVYYVQVKASPRSHTLTYKGPFFIPVGSTVTLPPLPWMNHEWTAEVIGTDKGEGYNGEGYNGDIKSVLSATFKQRN
jgi:hypothetical protein